MVVWLLLRGWSGCFLEGGSVGDWLVFVRVVGVGIAELSKKMTQGSGHNISCTKLDWVVTDKTD